MYPLDALHFLAFQHYCIPTAILLQAMNKVVFSSMYPSCCRYLVSQDSVVPVKALTECLSKHFPNFKFANGKEAEVKKVIDNSKVQSQSPTVHCVTCCPSFCDD